MSNDPSSLLLRFAGKNIFQLLEYVLSVQNNACIFYTKLCVFLFVRSQKLLPKETRIHESMHVLIGQHMAFTFAHQVSSGHYVFAVVS